MYISNTYIKNDNFIINEEIMDGEHYFIFYCPINEEMFVLNPTAYEIYDIIDQYENQQQIISYFKSKYKLTKEEEESIINCISYLIGKRLIICER